jgi:hypothetical protein
MRFPGLERGGDGAVGRPIVRDPSAKASGESEVFRDPSSEASDGAGGWAGLWSCLAGGPIKGGFSPFPFVDCFP